MKIKEENIRAIEMTFEPKDFSTESVLNIEKFKEAVKTMYVHRVNIPVECFPAYYETDLYKIIRDNTDNKTKVKFYIVVEKQNGTKTEQVHYYFDRPNQY